MAYSEAYNKKRRQIGRYYFRAKVDHPKVSEVELSLTELTCSRGFHVGVDEVYGFDENKVYGIVYGMYLSEILSLLCSQRCSLIPFFYEADKMENPFEGEFMAIIQEEYIEDFMLLLLGDLPSYRRLRT